MKKKTSNKRGRDYEIPIVLHEPVEFDMAADMKSRKEPATVRVEGESPALETFGGAFQHFEAVFRPKGTPAKRKSGRNGAKRKRKA